VLKSENLRLDQLLRAKAEHLNMLKHDPSSRLALKPLMELSQTNRELRRENEQQRKVLALLEKEKGELWQKLRRVDDSVTSSRQLQASLEASQTQVASYKEIEAKHLALKKEHSVLSGKYQAAINRNREMAQKLAKLTAEYEFIAAEYEKIFQNLTK
jgi:hypothetical protein